VIGIGVSVEAFCFMRQGEQSVFGIAVSVEAV
jgi:hypothetical protein